MFKFRFVIIIISTTCLVFSGKVFDSSPKGPVFLIGVKVGWEFGNQNGFILGLENSLVYLNDMTSSGLVFGYQYNLRRKTDAVYLEAECGSHYILGASIGTEFSLKNEPTHVYLRGWTGAFGYVSYRVPLYNGSQELAAVGKVPIAGYDSFENEK